MTLRECIGLVAYRAFLRLLPASLLRDHGDEMVRMFLDRQQAALRGSAPDPARFTGTPAARPRGGAPQPASHGAGRRPPLPLVRLWLREIPAVVTTAVKARSGAPTLRDPGASSRRAWTGSGERVSGHHPASPARRPLLPLPGKDVTQLMDTLIQDLRTGIRSLRGNPGFTTVAVVALALGIGASAAIFSVVHGVLQSLPYPAGERLALVYEDRAGDRSSFMQLSAPEYLALEADDGVFEELAAYQYSSTLLSGDPFAEQVPAVSLSHDFMDLLDSVPLHGRDFAAADEAGDAVVVVGYDLWQRRWGGDPDLVGETILLSDRAHEVIGITDADFTYFNDSNRLYTLLTFTPEQRAANRAHNLLVLGRLREDVGLELADERVAAVVEPAQRLDDHAADDHRTPFVHTLYDAWVGDVREPLLMLMGAVVLVVLIACANVANLEIARGMARRREMAVRLALGAGPGRIVRHLVTESMLLALLGGAAGLALAWLSMSWLQSLISTNLPRADNIELDLTVLGFATLVSVITGVLAGLAPAWVLSRQEIVAPMKESSSTVAGNRGAALLRKGFLVAQVSMALVLTVGAGLLLRSFNHLQAVDMGFDPEGVVLGTLASSGVPEFRGAEATRQLLDTLEERIAAHPDVEAVGATNMPPGTGFMIGEDFLLGDGATDEPVSPMMRIVDGGYFAALGVTSVEGRLLEAADHRPGATPVALVDEPFVRRHWPDSEAIGKQIRMANGGDGPWMTVVGVVAGAKATPFDETPPPTVYLPTSRASLRFPWLLVRGTAPPEALQEWSRTVVREVDDRIPAPALTSLDGMIANRLARQKLNSLLLGLFAGIALLLAAVGEYAVIQYVVRQRTSEIGIRMALGARASEVVSMVLRQGMVLAVAGIAVGLGAAWVASRLLESMLHGVDRTDPLTYGTTAAFLLVVAAAASFLPAWRAGHLDPMLALRSR